MKFIAYDLANLEIWKNISNYFPLTFNPMAEICIHDDCYYDLQLLPKSQRIFYLVEEMILVSGLTILIHCLG
jgi:hypothetical protein